MNLDELMQNVTAEIYANLKTALELGRWANGVKLTDAQKELCMEAIIRYEIEHNLPAHERVGYLENACQSGHGASFTSTNSTDLN